MYSYTFPCMNSTRGGQGGQGGIPTNLVLADPDNHYGCRIRGEGRFSLVGGMGREHALRTRTGRRCPFLSGASPKRHSLRASQREAFDIPILTPKENKTRRTKNRIVCNSRDLQPPEAERFFRMTSVAMVCFPSGWYASGQTMRALLGKRLPVRGAAKHRVSCPTQNSTDRDGVMWLLNLDGGSVCAETMTLYGMPQGV